MLGINGFATRYDLVGITRVVLAVKSGSLRLHTRVTQASVSVMCRA
jgi:hypothetical protein